MKIAIHRDDVERVPGLLRMMLQEKVRVNTKVRALAFTCDLLTGAVIADVLRDKDRQLDRSVTRVYVQTAREWSLLRDEVSVAEMIRHSTTTLSPKTFKRVKPMALVVFEPEKADSGRSLPSEKLV